MRIDDIRYWFVTHGWIMVVLALILVAVILLSWALALVKNRAERDEKISELQARVIAMLKANRPAPAELPPKPFFSVDLGWLFPISPDNYRILTSSFGERVSPLLKVGPVTQTPHKGVDISSTWRAQVVAVADGLVIDSYPPPGVCCDRNGDVFRGHDWYGGMLEIEHLNGMSTLYAHLSSKFVILGETVEAGDVIGKVGGTGRTDGEHLHFEVRSRSGVPLDPLLYIDVPL